MTRSQKRELKLGLFFASPYLIGFLGFTILPLIASFCFSFTDYDIFNAPKWIGVDNFVKLAQDSLFWTSLWNTAFYTVFAVPFGMITAFLLALLLNRRIVARPFFRTIFFLPSIVPLVAASVLWVWVFNSQYGYLNWALQPVCDFFNFLLGLHTAPPNWLQSPYWAKPALIIMSVWSVGGTMVLYLAALQDVPQSLYEVADLDGASSFRKVWHVTLPMVSPILFFTLVMGLIGALQIFTQAYIMTKGGQPGVSTLFYCLYLFQNAFEYFRLGYASAMAWILFAIIGVITAIVFKATGRFIYYEGGGGRMRRGFIPTHVATLALSAVFLFPFVWLLMSSVKPDALLKQWPPVWVFTPTLQHFRELFEPDSPFQFWQFLCNTLYVCAFTVAGNILASSMVAYGFARVKWPGRDLLFYAMLGTMMVPAQTMMIPVFLLFRKLGWVDTFLPLTIPTLFGNAFFIFMLRQFFLTVPRDLLDAARVDGHGEIAIWWRVVMPLSVPALAVVGLFSFLGAWNDFINPLIYLLDETRYTLSLGLAMFQGQYEAQYGRLMAASALMTCPIVILFFFAQRQFIEGIKMTGIKG